MITYTRPSLGPSADDLINATGIDVMSRAERWHLIDLIEKRIDTYQKWLSVAKPGGAAHQELLTNLKALRLKRFRVWSTFHPQYQNAIRLAA